MNRVKVEKEKPNKEFDSLWHCGRGRSLASTRKYFVRRRPPGMSSSCHYKVVTMHRLHTQ